MEDLQVQIIKLKAEIEERDQRIIRTIAEKTVIEHMHNECMQKLYILNTEFILKDAEFKKLQAEIDKFKLPPSE